MSTWSVKLVPEGAITTGTFPDLKGTQDHLVDVKPGRMMLKIPYAPIGEEAIKEFESKSSVPVVPVNECTLKVQEQFAILKEELW